MSKIALATTAALLTIASILGAGSVVSQAHAATSAQCAPSGPYSFPGLLPTATSNLDRTSRTTIAVLGAGGFKQGCVPTVVCVSYDNSKPSFEEAKLRCKTIRDALIAGKTGGSKAAESNAKAAVVLQAVRPEDGYSAGVILISFN